MIESVSTENLGDVLPLIRQYQSFYKVAEVAEVSDDKNRKFFSQFGTSSSLGCQFIYRQNSEAVGFATVYFSFASTITAKVAVLNDLYVNINNRGNGVGRQLVEHCCLYAKENGTARLQWVTAKDNVKAQKFYDGLGFKKSAWEFYSCKTS